MQRAFGGKRLAAGIAIASVAVTMAIIAGTSADASTNPTPRARVNSFTIDFTQTNVPHTPAIGAGFGGSGPVTDEAGKTIGTVDDVCDEAAVDGTRVTALCDSTVTIGDSEINLNTKFPMELNPAAYPYSFESIVQGGTGDYDGVTGQARFTAERPAVYKVTLDLK